MIWKTVVTLVLFCNGGTGSRSEGNTTTTQKPPLESILYNPAVSKRVLGNNNVEASTVWPSGQLHFKVQFKKEMLHGAWQSFYNNGQPCDSGAFVNNLPNGTWKTWFADGRLKTIRTYNAEKYHYIKNDQAQNHPKAWRYALTKMGRQANHYFKPQYAGEDAPYQTMLQKIQHNTSATETTYFAPFKACLHHGNFVTFTEDGRLKDSGYYVNGLPEGLWKTAEAESGFAQGMYRQGRRHGQWKFYTSDGKLAYTQWYKWNGTAVNKHHFKKD